MIHVFWQSQFYAAEGALGCCLHILTADQGSLKEMAKQPQAHLKYLLRVSRLQWQI